jgi:prepilin-type N-terminal cleavage/methylation domain-containing protein
MEYVMLLLYFFWTRTKNAFFSRSRVQHARYQSLRLKTGEGIFHKQGFTLIELMIGVGISGVLLAAVYGIFISQHRSWVNQNQISDTQQNARIAMEFLSRDIRLAGFGMPETAVNGFSDAITPANNVTNGTDEITFTSAYRQISTLAAAAAREDTSVTLQNSTDADKFDTGAKRYVYLDGISERDNYEITNIAGAQLTVTPSLRRDYNANAPVFLVKAVTYQVDFTDPDHSLLVRDENTGLGAQLIAMDIEDLQFAYQDVDGNWYNSPPVLEDILAVRITLIARTSREGREWDRADIGVRPAIEDHPVAAARDGYRRRCLATVVEVRNMGL